MTEKVGRNDPCPCGSGKKYKQCCAIKNHPGLKKKFTAKLISGGQKNLIEKTFSSAITSEKIDFAKMPTELPPEVIPPLKKDEG